MRPTVWLALLVALVGCTPVEVRVPPADEARQLVSEADAQVNAGGYPAAIRMFENVVRRFPSSAVHDRALYGLARALLLSEDTSRDYRRALGYFERLLREHPNTPYGPDARAWRSLLGAYLARTEELERLKQIDIEQEGRRP